MTSDAILAHAVDQIAGGGYDAVRLRDIAAAADVSIGQLQHRFGSREQLLARALEHHCRSLLSDRERIARDDDPLRRIESLVDRLGRTDDLRRRAVVWTEFNAAASRRPELRPALREINEAWRAHLRQAIDDGTARGRFAPTLDPATVAELLIAEIDGMLLAIAGDAARLSGRRMRERFRALARQLLGIGA